MADSAVLSTKRTIGHTYRQVWHGPVGNTEDLGAAKGCSLTLCQDLGLVRRCSVTLCRVMGLCKGAITYHVPSLAALQGVAHVPRAKSSNCCCRSSSPSCSQFVCDILALP